MLKDKFIKIGFTLSEVLITLVIIGVVVAITIPAINVQVQKQITLEALKKTYSALAQTTNRAIADNGPISSWEIQSGAAHVFNEVYLIPYLNVLKNCGYSLNAGCNFKYKTLGGEERNLDYSHARFILLDGTLVATTANRDTTYGQIFSYVWVDVNGEKGPNIAGRDVFTFIYFIYNEKDPKLNGKFIGYPYACSREMLLSDTKFGCNRHASGYHSNIACAALLMRDNWQFKKGYPW